MSRNASIISIAKLPKKVGGLDSTRTHPCPERLPSQMLVQLCCMTEPENSRFPYRRQITLGQFNFVESAHFAMFLPTRAILRNAPERDQPRGNSLRLSYLRVSCRCRVFCWAVSVRSYAKELSASFKHRGQPRQAEQFLNARHQIYDP